MNQRLSGSVRSLAAPQLAEVLAKALAESPPCLVCELSEVTWLDPACVAVWVGAQWPGPWPGPVLWLVGAHNKPADAPGHGRRLFVGLADTAEAALAQMPTPPPLRRVRLLMAPTPIAPGRARRFTIEVLARWALSPLTGDATLIVSELVTNALVHAGSDLELRLGHGRDLLHLAVRDHGSVSGPAPGSEAAGPAADRHAGMAEHGRGLQIVQALAFASGRTRTPAGGSVSWATLATGERATRRGAARQP